MARRTRRSAQKRVTTWTGYLVAAPIVVSYVVLGAAVLVARSLRDAMTRVHLGPWWPGHRGG